MILPPHVHAGQARSRFVFAIVGMLLVALPLVTLWGYRIWTAYPDQVRVALGQPQGFYRPLARGLIAELNSAEQEHGLAAKGVDAVPVQSGGSWDNVVKLQAGEVDFALYQAGTVPLKVGARADMNGASIAELYKSFSEIRFVGNLYSEVVHVVVPESSAIRSIAQLNGRRVAVGSKGSGSKALAAFLLSQMHAGTIIPWPVASAPDEVLSGSDYYERLTEAFANGHVDAAFITMGMQPGDRSELLVPRLLRDGEYRLLPIEFGRALQRRHLLVEPYTIARGSYRPDLQQPVPPQDIETVAVKAKLLTHSQADPRVVEAVTRLVLSEPFHRDNKLEELFSRAREDRFRFASRAPEFPVHPGANRVYVPEEFGLKQVEGLEALYSLLASLGIAGFLGFRWYQKRVERKREHKLDRWIHALLDIERRQMPLDALPGYGDSGELEQMLDEITELRMEALAEFSAHELNDDRAIHCFIDMCSYLSNKINMKLTRQRMDFWFRNMST